MCDGSNVRQGRIYAVFKEIVGSIREGHMQGMEAVMWQWILGWQFNCSTISGTGLGQGHALTEYIQYKGPRE